MGESKTTMKVEQEIKPIKDLCDRILTLTKAEVDKGVECLDTKELGEAIDMIKDLAQAKKEMVEVCYKMQIMDAMEKAEYGVDYDERGRMRNYPPIRMYTPMEDSYPYYSYEDYMRDMDKKYGRMYYGGNSSSGGNSGYSGTGGNSGSSGMGGGSRGYSEGMPEGYESYNVNMSSRPVQVRDPREGRSATRRKMYMEAKENHKDKTIQMEELEKYMKELSRDITEMIEDASPEEKQVLQQKISTLATKIK